MGTATRVSLRSTRAMPVAYDSTQCYTHDAKRALKTKSLARWCTLTDEALRRAAREIERGEYEADLRKGVVKKRVAYPGRGKRGGARLLVAHRMKECIIFLVGRDKNDPGTDFTRAQEDAAKELALAYAKLSADKLLLA